MTRAIIAALLCAAPAAAQERHQWGHAPGSSYVELSAPTDLGCTALVTFLDKPVHTGLENFSLTRNGLTVDFRIVYNGGMPGETLYIAPPAGHYARPDMLEPGEHQTGTAHICPLGVAS